jgi:hypothetical protein
MIEDLSSLPSAMNAPSMKTLALILLAWLVAFPLSPASVSEPPAVPCWQPHDFSFTAKATSSNPFLTEFSAIVTGPDGKTFTLPGFFDGEGTWKVRVAPTAPGKWSLVTKSELPELTGHKAAFTGVNNSNPKNHGVLRVDREHPHHFIFADGTRFFMQAYAYDWLWALDMDKPGVPTIEKTLDLIASHGFNYISVNSFAFDTDWRKGNTGADDFGPPAMFPWAGSNAAPDHARMNLAYWRHYDRMMTAMLDRGLQAHLYIKVYNKAVNWPARGSAEERLFFRWLVARYAAYPNLIWDFSKEAHNEKDIAYKQDWLKWLRENDPYHHLITVNDDDMANDSGAYDALTDFRADQHHGKKNVKGRNANWTGGKHDKILAQRKRRAWPVANVESDYECGPGGLDDKTYGVVMTPEATVSTLWEIAMAGGYAGYYYTYTAWDVIRPLDEPKGYTYMKHFGDFWRATDYWLLKPADKQVSTGWCLANHGKEYVAYQGKPTPFNLEISSADRNLTGQWYNLFTGKRTQAGSFGNGQASLMPPADWGDAPVVLHLKAR